jgi:hypothetical protein
MLLLITSNSAGVTRIGSSVQAQQQQQLMHVSVASHLTHVAACLQVVVYTAETYYTSPGQRKINIYISGKQVSAGIDPFAAAGGRFISTPHSFVRQAPASGKLRITLNATVNNPSIAGIAVYALGPPPPAPKLFAPYRGIAKSPYSRPNGTIKGTEVSTSVLIYAFPDMERQRGQNLSYCEQVILNSRGFHAKKINFVPTVYNVWVNRSIER